jgi:hypothetical protein
MRRFTISLLSLFFLSLFGDAFLYAQPTLLEPAKTTSTVITSRRPTFKWSQVANATQYEFYLTTTLTDTAVANRTSIPLASTVNKYKKYVSVGTASTDTTFTLADTMLSRNAVGFWKVRAKVGGTWGLWAYPYSYFKVGVMPYQLSDANGFVKINQDTLAAVSSIRFTGGSGLQLLDTTYNAANLLGLGGIGATKDTPIVWSTSSNTDTCSFTYINTAKYGKTGSKVLTVSRGTDGITVNVVLNLETGKSLDLAAAWTPGGAAGGNDNVLFVKSAATKTQLTYPATAATFGPDSIVLSAMYDKNFNEYFGFKSASPIAVSNTQSTGLLKQVLSFSNSSGSLKAYTFSFAVRKTRADYFDTWAKNRPIFISTPATGDTVVTKNKYVAWESFGATPAQIAFSSDGGTTFGNTLNITKDTTALDSAQYSMPNGILRNNCVVQITSSKNDIGRSGVFVLNTPYSYISAPSTGATIALGDHYVIWDNETGGTLTKVDLSLDSGKTYSNVQTINSTSALDSVLYTYAGGKTASAHCFVRVYDATGDTIISDMFSIGKGAATFSISTILGDPASTIYVPVSAADYIAGDSIKSFDIKLTFDSTFVHFDSLIYNTSLDNWITMMDSSNTKSTNLNFVRVAAFKNTTGAGVKNSEIFKLKFTIKDKQELIGQNSTFVIKNSVLAASGNGASALDVAGSVNGTLKIYSSISGSLHYFHEKWDGSTSNTVSGDSIVHYYDSTNTVNNSIWSVVNGYFHLSNREPNNVVNFYPAATEYTSAGLNEITVEDAKLAFADWYDTLSVRAKIAADVNGDGVVNTTDAMAIMQISVDSTYLAGSSLSNWIFVDSTSLATIETGADSLTAWYAGQKHAISYTLTHQRVHQDFFGVLRGDVNFSYGASASVTTLGHKATINRLKTLKPAGSETTTSPALFSTDANVNVRPGDSLWIPLIINPSNNDIGGFNASMQVDPALFTYTGQFKTGASIPQGKNWYVTAKSDANGKLKVAATDFSRNVTPIVQDGPALLFKYVVNKNAKLGATGAIDIQTQSVVDTLMQKVSTLTTGGTTSVTRMGSTVATSFELSQNYPNPFNPTTTIEFALPADSKVDIAIFNLLGQKIATLFSGSQTAGYHQVVWNASKMSSGVYFYMMKATSNADGAKFQTVKKLMLMK